MSIAVIYGGTRINGNTEILTERVIQGLDAERIYLRDYHILPIVDERHEREGFRPVLDDHQSVIERILPHDILIFATPIYWYSMSGIMKNFVDRWSQTLRDENVPSFKVSMQEKQAFVVAVGGDDPYIKGLPMIQQFQHIFDFIGIPFKGYVIGDANRPGEIVHDHTAIHAADELRKKIYELNSDKRSL